MQATLTPLLSRKGERVANRWKPWGVDGRVGQAQDSAGSGADRRASARPHVGGGVGASSRLDHGAHANRFYADGKVASLVHDWVFDEMYSAFAIQGLAPPGELVKRETFAPLAKENAGGLADIGYFTTLKLDGKAVEFAPGHRLLDGGASDHLVAFTCRSAAEDAPAGGRFGSLIVADPNSSSDFEFDDKDGVAFVSAPEGCSNSYAKPKPLDGGDKKTLDESPSSAVSRPGPNFGLKMASRVIIACP